MPLLDQKVFIVADDHPLFRDALSHAIGKLAPEAEIIEADSLESLQQVVDANPDADLLLLDLNMPGVTSISAVSVPWSLRPDGFSTLSTKVPSVPCF